MKVHKVTSVAYMNQSYENLRNQTLRECRTFKDKVFPCCYEAIGERGRYAEIKWKRPAEISQTPKLFEDVESTKIIRSSDLTSLNVLSGCAMLVTFKPLLHLVIPDYEQQEVNMHTSPNSGIFHFRFWRHGEWVDVVVDDMLPTCGGIMLGLQSQRPNEFWAALLEKAYAKLYGSYEALHRLKLSDVLEDFTSGMCTFTNVIAEPEPLGDNKAFYRLLSDELKKLTTICFSRIMIESIPEEAKAVEPKTVGRSKLGINKDHVYIVTAVRKVPLTSVTSTKPHLYMVQLRDPIRCGDSLFKSPSLVSVILKFYGDIKKIKNKNNNL